MRCSRPSRVVHGAKRQKGDNLVADLVTLGILFVLIFAINLMPAFGPPTWSIIVLYGLNTDLPLVWIILMSASAAASGRFLLASGFRLLGNRIPGKFHDNLAAARALFERNRRNGYIALSLFALSPVPSAQLFEAAGLAKVRLAGFTAAFFFGRIISYSIYAVTAKELKQSSLGKVFADSISSPLAIAIQLAMIALLVGLARVDWQRRLRG
jgi:uncharacterized membrane protein YdjX (TVP38/TMEM64 family)